jgi:hypothetical protein
MPGKYEAKVAETERQLNLHLSQPRFLGCVPIVKCKKGSELSIQASPTHYSIPKDEKGPYRSVEVGQSTNQDPIRKLEPYKEGHRARRGLRIYAYAPLRLVAEVVVDRGGIVGFGHVLGEKPTDYVHGDLVRREAAGMTVSFEDVGQIIRYLTPREFDLLTKAGLTRGRVRRGDWRHTAFRRALAIGSVSDTGARLQCGQALG